MTQKCFWSVVLIVVLSLTLVTPANANGYPSNGEIVGGIVGIVAAATALILVVIYVSRSRSITGCVRSGPSGMSITDEKDQRSYSLSGDAAGVAAGDRMRLRGRKAKAKDQAHELVWEVRKVSKDFGVCQP